MPKKFDEEQTLLDKSAWGDGPWQREPDFVRFRHLGLPCLITRQDHSGHLCGYVAVPLGHPWHGEDYDAIDAEVHGRITYCNPCAHNVCHVPKPGESDDVWWVGFDCAHGMSDYRPFKVPIPDGLTPELLALVTQLEAFNAHGTYRDLAYVHAEVLGLADQARSAQGWTKHL